MPRGMTGFGRSDLVGKDGRISFEVRSYNHRFLEIRISLPDILKYLEIEIMALIKGKVKRGNVEVRAFFSPTRDSIYFEIEEGVISKYIELMERIRGLTNLGVTVDLFELLRSEGIMRKRLEDEDSVRDLVLRAANEALDRLISSREREGEAIADDISRMVEDLMEIVGKVEEKSEDVKEREISRIKERISAMISGIEDERLVSELGIQKLDISEEISRLKLYLAEMKEILLSKDSIGRRIDFLAQEVMREVNTISSKSPDYEIRMAVVRMKERVERIREQAQNLE